MSKKRPWRRGQSDGVLVGTPPTAQETHMDTIEERDDADDAKEAEEARQEPGERVSLEEYIEDRSNEKCREHISLEDYEGKTSEHLCQLPGEHLVHMARGEVQGGDGGRSPWKLIWEVRA